MRAAKKILRSQSGIALLTTILLMLLMSSLLVGFILLINSGQKLSGINSDYGRAFYAAQAGMEKLTADLGTLFDANYAPPTAQINALQNNPPVITDISYINGDGTPGYTITSPNPVDGNGNYLPTVTQIQSGAYQGMTALATPYVMNVTARTSSGSEVKLQRTTQTVGIPMFQFGVFCDPDCSYFAGPNFNFGGRTHTNGNLFLASGATLTMSQSVTAYKDVSRPSAPPAGLPTRCASRSPGRWPGRPGPAGLATATARWDRPHLIRLTAVASSGSARPAVPPPAAGVPPTPSPAPRSPCRRTSSRACGCGRRTDRPARRCRAAAPP